MSPSSSIEGSPVASPPEPVLEVRSVRKRFGRVLALDDVDFTAFPGEIHALLGENGAGKSTLMQIASGLYAPDAGRMRLAGRDVAWRSADQARAAGVAMVHQHFMLVPTLTVAENLALARGTRGWLDRAELDRETLAFARDFRLAIPDPSRRIDEISVGDRQRVEILKALIGEGIGADGRLHPPGLLILDEPTAVLTPDEVSALFELLEGLAARGAAIVIVTHKLPEVLRIADRVTILRAGRVIASGAAADQDERSLATAMVGTGRDRAPAASGPSGDAIGAPPREGARLLRLEGVSARDVRGAPVLDAVSLDVAAGELVVIAGVEGNGQAELVSVLDGTARDRLRDVRGRVEIDGQRIERASDARAARLAVVPADRVRDGLVAELPAWENLLLDVRRLAAAAPRGWIRRPAALRRASASIAEFGVQPADPLRSAGALSGGNQQRLILARELGDPAPRAIVAANPSRGLDLAATAAIRARLRALAAAGAAVLVLSSDLDEVEELAGTVAVLFRGRLLRPASATPDRAEIGRLMAGSGVAT
ncbi:MAG: ATP-binding cassette domain-containing protein [Deltaproteobacteria bacterium]